MTSQTELLTLKFYYFEFFELVTRCGKIFNIVLDLVTRGFKTKWNLRVTNSKIWEKLNSRVNKYMYMYKKYVYVY